MLCCDAVELFSFFNCIPTLLLKSIAVLSGLSCTLNFSVSMPGDICRKCISFKWRYKITVEYCDHIYWINEIYDPGCSSTSKCRATWFKAAVLVLLEVPRSKLNRGSQIHLMAMMSLAMKVSVPIVVVNQELHVYNLAYSSVCPGLTYCRTKFTLVLHQPLLCQWSVKLSQLDFWHWLNVENNIFGMSIGWIWRIEWLWKCNIGILTAFWCSIMVEKYQVALQNSCNEEH